MKTDFLLIQKVKSGKIEASEHFVKKYYSSIYRYCFLHIHNCDCAEDMTQETFLRFFESLDRYHDYGKTKSYLYCIAGNIVKNYYKKKKEMLMDEIPDLFENSMDDIAGTLDIEQAVDNLPDELKEITILFFFQELRQREIAELLNIKLSLVKYRISRAKKILSVCFEECER